MQGNSLITDVSEKHITVTFLLTYTHYGLSYFGRAAGEQCSERLQRENQPDIIKTTLKSEGIYVPHPQGKLNHCNNPLWLNLN